VTPRRFLALLYVHFFWPLLQQGGSFPRVLLHFTLSVSVVFFFFVKSQAVHPCRGCYELDFSLFASFPFFFSPVLVGSGLSINIPLLVPPPCFLARFYFLVCLSFADNSSVFFFPVHVVVPLSQGVFVRASTLSSFFATSTV